MSSIRVNPLRLLVRSKPAFRQTRFTTSCTGFPVVAAPPLSMDDTSESSRPTVTEITTISNRCDFTGAAVRTRPARREDSVVTRQRKILNDVDDVSRPCRYGPGQIGMAPGPRLSAAPSDGKTKKREAGRSASLFHHGSSGLSIEGPPGLPGIADQVRPRIPSTGRYCGRSAESSSPRASLQRSLIMKFFRPASRTFLLRTVKHMGQRYTIASAPLAFASSTFFTRKGS